MTDFFAFSIQALRAIISLAMVAFLPGFLLSYILFLPQALDPLERFFVSFIASFVISSLIGSFLALSTLGLGLDRFLLVWVGVVALLSGGAIWRLKNVAVSDVRKPLAQVIALIINSTKVFLLKYRLPAATVFGLIFLVFLSASFFEHRSAQLAMTEFYISPSSLEQLLDVDLNQPREIIVPVEITNHEGQNVLYRIVPWYGDRTGKEKTGLFIHDGETLRTSIKFRLQKKVQPFPVDLVLYSNLSSIPVARLRLWFGGSSQ